MTLKTIEFDDFSAGVLRLGCVAESVERIEYIIGEEALQIPQALIVVSTVGDESVISNRAGRAAWPSGVTNIVVTFNAVDTAPSSHVTED